MQPEAKIVKKILDCLNVLPECKAEKNHGTQFGHCKLDITGAIHGKMFQIEVKVPKKRPTAKQQNVIEEWRSVGVVSGCATSTKQAINIIAPLLTQQDRAMVEEMALSRKNYGMKHDPEKFVWEE